MIRMTPAEANKRLGMMFKIPKSKYNNKKTIIDGKKFDSQSEGKLYYELKLQERQGLIKGVETQVKESFYAYGKHICDYYVDFLVYYNDGRKEFIEHKATGTVTATWRLKYKMLEAKYANDKNIIVSTNWYKGYRVINRNKDLLKPL